MYTAQRQVFLAKNLLLIDIPDIRVRSESAHPCTAPDNEFDEMSNSLLSSGRAEADILFSVCFQVCGSFGAGAEKPASDDAGTGKRLEPETGFCVSKKPPKY